MSKKTQRERQERAYRQRLIIIVVAVILVLSVGIALLVYFLNRSQGEGAPRDPNESKQITQEAARVKRNGQTRNDAAKEAATGNTQKVDQIYQAAIQSEADTTQKIKLYIDQSEVLFNSGRYDEAFAAAKKGGELSTDKYLMADWLSRIYEQHGDFKDAGYYYTLAGQWASSPTNVSGFDKAYYDAAASDMATKAKAAGQL